MGAHKALTSRNNLIEAAYCTGATLADIGPEFGLTRSRIQQIIGAAIAAGRLERRRRDPDVCRASLVAARAKIQLLARAGMLQRDIRRNEAIERALEQGATFGQISLRFGVSRNVPAGISWRARRRADAHA